MSCQPQQVRLVRRPVGIAGTSAVRRRSRTASSTGRCSQPIRRTSRKSATSCAPISCETVSTIGVGARMPHAVNRRPGRRVTRKSPPGSTFKPVQPVRRWFADEAAVGRRRSASVSHVGTIVMVAQLDRPDCRAPPRGHLPHTESGFPSTSSSVPVLFESVAVGHRQHHDTDVHACARAPRSCCPMPTLRSPKTRWSPQRTPPPIMSPMSKCVRGPVQYVLPEIDGAVEVARPRLRRGTARPRRSDAPNTRRSRRSRARRDPGDPRSARGCRSPSRSARASSRARGCTSRRARSPASEMSIRSLPMTRVDSHPTAIPSAHLRLSVRVEHLRRRVAGHEVVGDDLATARARRSTRSPAPGCRHRRARARRRDCRGASSAARPCCRCSRSPQSCSTSASSPSPSTQTLVTPPPGSTRTIATLSHAASAHTLASGPSATMRPMRAYCARVGAVAVVSVTPALDDELPVPALGAADADDFTQLRARPVRRPPPRRGRSRLGARLGTRCADIRRRRAGRAAARHRVRCRTRRPGSSGLHDRRRRRRR